MDNLVSIQNKKAEWGGRLCVKRERAITCMLFGDLHFEFLCFGLLQKEVWRKFFQTWIYYCHACHTRFAIALLSSAIDLHDNCLRSLLNVNQNGNLSSQTLLLSVLYVDQLPTLSPLKKVKWFSVFVSLWKYNITFTSTLCKENHFYSLPFGQTEASIILLTQTSFQLASKAFWQAELISQFFCYSNSPKNITCPLGMLKTKFTSLIAKSTSHRLSDTTFFALCK